MMDSKLFGIDIGYLIVAVALTAAGIVFIRWLRKRGPTTAKGVHHADVKPYPPQVEVPEDDGN